jgi:hypothetical protein
MLIFIRPLSTDGSWLDLLSSKISNTDEQAKLRLVLEFVYDRYVCRYELHGFCECLLIRYVEMRAKPGAPSVTPICNDIKKWLP